MVVNHKLPWHRILQDLKWPLLLILIYMTTISLVDRYHPLDKAYVPLSLITVLGTVLGLLLAFRTNSAYDRWWEARKIWGAIVNDSRSLIRQVLVFLRSPGEQEAISATIQKIAERQIVWGYLLANHLREKEMRRAVDELIDRDDADVLRSHSNIPNGLLQLQALDLRKASDRQWLGRYELVHLEGTLVRLTDSLGKCERIKNTVFPSSYSLLVELLIYLFILLLPFGLVEFSGIILIPTTLSLAFSFLVIDQIAIYLQDPFANMASDTPMNAISTTIEINIRQMLSESNVPPPPKPHHGVLM